MLAASFSRVCNILDLITMLNRHLLRMLLQWKYSALSQHYFIVFARSGVSFRQ